MTLALPGAGSASVGGKPETEEFLATAVTEAEVRSTIRKVYQENGYIADPHTAVGLAAADRFKVSGTEICVATAHPAKFPESVNEAIGEDVARHERLDALKGRETRKTVIPATTDAVRTFLDRHAR